ncbi:multidrug/spermidine efflux SMR transporter subunit MdtI [Rosenbergiella metrosideri]|uniref:multidrug/spermidine efflux SMR transporter subunit MdtI n=1 Tax=Rosenbergiella metrosideri TaxID=2921185 RepID=UPI001F4FCB71|nr:multidrug/spermidine efflux SMR transporter subunit MdtI [Rosenbergiella metrosideri]
MIAFLLEWQHSLWLLLAVIVEIIANVLLKLSNGFQKKSYGILSLIAVLAAFSALGQAVKGIDLAVAYALWGGLGLLATIAFGWILFGQRLNWIGGIGILLLLLGMAIIKLA